MLFNQGHISAGPAVGPLSGSYIATTNDASTATIFDIAVSFGTEHPTRHLAVVVHSRNNGTPRAITAITIGGIAATIIGTRTEQGQMGTGIYYAKVPTGTSGNVSIQFANAMQGCAVSVWRIVDADNISVVGTASATGANPSTAAITTVTNGFVIAGFTRDGAIDNTPGWTEVTQRFNTALTDFHVGGADLTPIATSYAISAGTLAAGSSGLVWKVASLGVQL